MVVVVGCEAGQGGHASEVHSSFFGDDMDIPLDQNILFIPHMCVHVRTPHATISRGSGEGL